MFTPVHKASEDKSSKMTHNGVQQLGMYTTESCVHRKHTACGFIDRTLCVFHIVQYSELDQDALALFMYNTH